MLDFNERDQVVGIEISELSKRTCNLELSEYLYPSA